MQYVPEESREGFYDVYYTDEGERLVVLEGLNPDQRIELYPLQEYLAPRAERIEMFYWVLIFGVACTLLLSQVIIPLYKRMWAQ